MPDGPILPDPAAAPAAHATASVEADPAERTYNGWPSYETWLVFTWLTNDEMADWECRELAAAQEDAYQATDALRQFVEDASPLAGQASLYADLIGAALARVRWEGLARYLRAGRV